MKKSLLFCGVAALAFASCTQNEVLDVNENRAIGFESFVGKPTKAVNDLTKDELNGFYVFGNYTPTPSGTETAVFSNEVVTKSGENWNTTTTAYWQPNSTYKFAAYADGTSYPKIDGATFTSSQISIPYTVSTNDLILATKEVTTGDDVSSVGNVQLVFNHLLSKVKFTFTSGFTSPTYKMTISNLKFNAPKKGTYTTEWTGHSDPADYEFATISDIETGTPGESEENYVLPQSNSTLEVTFTVKVTDGGSFNKTNNLKASLNVTEGDNTGEWVSGYVYNYKATITPANVDPSLEDQVIKFTVDTVEDWQNHNDPDGDDLGTITTVPAP